MPELRPFRGLRYEAARIPDLSAVLCPPYDVISPSERERLLARSPANAVRLELPAATPAAATDEDFATAAETLRTWLNDGTLVRDEQPMIYVYEQRFSDDQGGSRSARSFFCELRLESYGPDSGVRPHEHTLGPAKEHRFQLLSATQTHLSPVLLIYQADTIDLLDAIVASSRPAEANGPSEVGQRLWRVDPALVPEANELLAVAGAQALTIADGHHRYETALRYRDTPGAPAGADHVMALLYGADDHPLMVEPWHRVIAGVADPARVLEATRDLFDGQPIASADDLADYLKSSTQPGVLGVWTRAGGAVLRVDRSHLAPFVDAATSPEVRWLDVSVLSGTLGRMVGADEAELAAEGRLSYTHDAHEAVRDVDTSRADVCFLLRATPIEDVLAVAAAGDFMPPKSTYFYPKAATGLVFDPLF